MRQKMLLRHEKWVDEDVAQARKEKRKKQKPELNLHTYLIYGRAPLSQRRRGKFRVLPLGFANFKGRDKTKACQQSAYARPR